MIIYGTDSILPLLRQSDALAHALSRADLEVAVEPLMWFVERAGDGPGIKLAPSGRLGRAIVQAADERFEFTPLAQNGCKAQTEVDVPPAVALRGLARKLGLVRTHKGRVVATAKGRTLLTRADDPAELRDVFRSACSLLCCDDDFASELTALMLVLLVDAGPDGRAGMDLYDELGSILARRWNIARVGNPPHDRFDIAWEASDTRGKLDALRLLVPNDDFHLALNGAAGLAGAALALHARLEAASSAEHPSGSSPLIEWASTTATTPPTSHRWTKRCEPSTRFHSTSAAGSSNSTDKSQLSI